MSIRSVAVRCPRRAQAGAIPRRIVLATAVFALMTLASLPGAFPARAQTTVQVEVAATRHIYVTQFKSVTVRFGKPFASTVVGAPDIADVLPMSDRVIYIQGKKIGTTNISAFDKDKQLIAIIDVTVAIDTASIAGRSIPAPATSGIRVSSSNGQVVLSGMANDATVADGRWRSPRRRRPSCR